jgi:hypothetical protein
MSVPFWTGKLMELFEKERTTLDKEEVAKLTKHIRTAFEACSKMGLDHQLFDRNLHLSLFISAMISQDDKLLRERLQWVKEKDDKRLRDDTAQWLGDAARFVPLDAYKNVLKAWKDELNYKPKWFWIAWRAALNGAPQHALLVGEMAKNEYKDDLSFTEEYDYMKKLFDSAAIPVPVKPSPAPVPAKVP